MIENPFDIFDHVDKHGPEGCWLWLAAFRTGYGVAETPSRALHL
jgi:hypothetical protein